MKTSILIALIIVIDGFQASGNFFLLFYCLSIIHNRFLPIDSSLILLLHFYLFITNFIDAEEGCSDGYASDHKQAYLDVYGQNWHSVYNWKWCDMSCGALAAAGYCTLSWKSSLYCSNQDLKVQDTCKQSCGKCRKYIIFVL